MYREDKYMNKIRNILKMNRYYKNITMPKYALLSYTLILLFVSCGQKDKLSIKDQLVTNEALLTSTLNNDSLIYTNLMFKYYYSPRLPPPPGPR